MTDGFIGNEEAILAYMAGHLGGARLFSFGVGDSVNRYLLDKMAEFGRGGVEYVLPGEDSGKAIRRFYDRIRSPYLTDIRIDWGGLGVADMYPREIPDLFLGQPVSVYGRYAQPGRADVTVRARLGGRPWELRFSVDLPSGQPEGEAIGTLWARSRLEDLSDQLIVSQDPALIDEITRVALDHHLVSKYTSFVAVEERIDTGQEMPALVEVPVCTPPGVSYEMTYAAPAGTSTSTTFDSAFIDALPILGRNYQDVLNMAPGVSNVNGDGNPTVRGSRDTDVITLVDGASVPEVGGVIGGDLSLDSIQEIEVTTAGATAAFGQSTGGVVKTMPAAPPAPPAGVIVRISAPRSEYRAGEVIEILLTIENRTGKPIRVPAALSVSQGSARFRVLDAKGIAAADPVPARGASRMMTLAPGAQTTLRIHLNGKGGYRCAGPGDFRITLLGSSLGWIDSNTIALRIGG